MDKQKTLFLLVCIILFFSLLPMVYFSAYFSNNSISENINDWGSFGSYIGGASSALTIPLTLVLLVSTYRSQKSVEYIAIRSFNNQKFEKRFFELFNIFNEYRYRQLESWTQQGEKEDKVYYRGVRFFIPMKQLLYTQMSNGKNFEESFIHAINFQNIALEFYFRCLDNLLFGIEEIKDFEERLKLLYLIKNSLSNDEKFFIKYFDLYEKYKGFKMIEAYKIDLTDNLFHDYKEGFKLDID
jgi:hypothetical protein